jgi:hypothetical protein
VELVGCHARLLGARWAFREPVNFMYIVVLFSVVGRGVVFRIELLRADST